MSEWLVLQEDCSQAKSTGICRHHCRVERIVFGHAGLEAEHGLETGKCVLLAFPQVQTLVLFRMEWMGAVTSERCGRKCPTWLTIPRS